jgi:hypothetical protein
VPSAIEGTAAKVVGSLVSTPYFQCTNNWFHGVCVAWKHDEPLTSAAAVDEFVHRQQWMDPPETGGSLGYLVEEALYQVPIALVVMMEPSLQCHGTPKAWGSPCKKREGFSVWKGKSPRIAEKGDGCTIRVT